MRSKFPFVLSESQGGALLILLMGIVFLFAIRYGLRLEEDSGLDLAETLLYQRKLDSLRSNQVVSVQPKPTYNPNYLSDYNAYRLGIPAEAFDRLQRYRAGGNYVNSLSEFQLQSGISDHLLEELAPALRFPNFRSQTKKKTAIVKQDLNTVDATALEVVSGIGPTLSKRIVNYRTYLSGFSIPAQCYEVYGLDSTVVARLFERFEIQSPPKINPLNIETASLNQLAKLPYLSREDARKIIAYRTKNKGISLLLLSEVFVDSPNKIERIKLYLY